MAEKINIAGAQAFESLARAELPRLLEEWSGLPARKVSDGPLPELEVVHREVDMVLEWAGYRVIVDVKSGSKVAQVDGAIRRLQEYLSPYDEPESPLLAVPHMGAAGARRCAAVDLNWADLSGNAEIRLGGIRIHRRGQPNRFTFSSSRPNPFSAKASRIPRALLMQPDRWWKQEELIFETLLSRGYVSQIVSELKRHQLVVRDEDYRIRSDGPDVLLDSWLEEYSPRSGARISGHVPSRTGEDLSTLVSSRLAEEDVKYGLTALAAAWRYGPSAMFRNVHVYVASPPSDQLRNQLGFREGRKGANLHFLVSEDPAVWAGAEEVEGAVCVSPLQAYLDLKGLGERSEEAALELRRQRLDWASIG